jgi:serine/threonine protein phosphatase PrpC
MISEAEDLKAAVETLIDSANEQGGKDNISVVLVKYEEM